MGTPVQITVTVDSNGAVTGFQQIGGAATTMGQQVATSGLKGQAAIDALTKQWNAEQAAIAAVNARIRENMAAQEAQSAAIAKQASMFQGLTNEQTKANVSGRLLEQTFGLQNRALNQIASRSALLGPLMAGAFPLAIMAGAVPILVKIGDEIVNATNDWGGYTKAVQQVHDETVKASREAFLNPKTLADAQAHLNQLNSQVGLLNKASAIEISRSQMIAEQATLEGKIVALLFAGSINHAASAQEQAKVTSLTKDQKELLEAVANLHAKINDEIARSQESTALIGKSGFSKIAQEHANSLADISRSVAEGLDPQQAAAMRTDAEKRANAEILELRRQNAMETMKLQDQVTEDALTGIAKIKQEEADHVKETLAEDMQKMGLSEAEVQRTALYQAQIAKIHQDTSNKIIRYNVQQDSRVRELQDRAIKSALTGDAAILASAQKEKEAVGALYAKGELDDAHYNAIIRLINQETNAKLQAEDQKTFDKLAQQQARTVEMQQRAAEDMKTAQEDAALAVVPEWQRASAQIQIELNRRERAIEDQKLRELAAEHLTQDQILAINQDADAKRYDAIVQADIRIREENKRLTESLGSDLQSVFDDIGSGNIGKRILANMEKMFFQIVAQWILSLNIMKSAAGSILGSIVFGPGSTGAGVFGGGGSSGGGVGSIIGSLFGGGDSKPSGAAFQPGGIFSDPSTFAGGSGLSSAIAGTGAAPGGGVFTSASNALTSATMADALGGVTAGASSLASSSARTSSFAAGSPLAGLAALAPGLIGGFGGKAGQIGGLLSMLAIIGNSQILAGLSGGLIGFGVGASHGGVLGSLAGAGSGALTGFLAAGPIGALIGGVVGLLGGIFGGIFGGSKRKKQANALADNTLLPDIAQISAGFDSFQIDSNSAIQQLEQLRNDSQKQLSALQSQGKSVFNQKVSPAIDAAEAHIRSTQAERDRRSSLHFGPPQFETGGMFTTRGGSAGLAVLHDGEVVINSKGSKKNMDTLAAINAGKTVGSHIEVHIHPDTFDRAYVRSRQFEQDIMSAITRASVEGRF